MISLKTSSAFILSHLIGVLSYSRHIRKLAAGLRSNHKSNPITLILFHRRLKLLMESKPINLNIILLVVLNTKTFVLLIKSLAFLTHFISKPLIKELFGKIFRMMCKKNSHAQTIPLLKSLAPSDNYFPVIKCENLKQRHTQLEFIKHRFDSASVQRPQTNLITFCLECSVVSEFCLIKTKIMRSLHSLGNNSVLFSQSYFNGLPI